MTIFWCLAVCVLVVYPFGVIVSTIFNIVNTFIKTEWIIFKNQFVSICRFAVVNGLAWPITICIIGVGFLACIINVIMCCTKQ